MNNNLFKYFKSDMLSGMVVFLVALPLCLGIAVASGAPPFAGIITGIIGGILVGALSGSHVSVSGPAAGLIAIVLAAVTNLGYETFLLAVVLAGGIQLLLGIAKAGGVSSYFPSGVIEVMSLGAKFVEVEGAADASKAGGYAVEQTEDFMKRQKAKIAESVAKADIIITTAQIPGRKAPILITTEMLGAMKSGSVIIDLAAATGGNTELTKNNETVMHNGIRIVGNSFLPATMPSDASKLYGKNILNFLQLMITKEGELNLNFEDDLVLGTCITDNQQIVHDRIREMIN